MSSFVSRLAAAGLAAAAAALVGAAPATAPDTMIERRAIDADLFSTFTLMEQFAAAAYCPSNNNSTGNKLTCSVGNCPLVEAANTNTVTEFENSLVTDVTGYVATDSTNSLIVVAFRGSESVRNWLANLNFPTVDTDICDGCQAVGGTWNSWIEARDGVLAAVKSAAAANPSYQIVAVGHSLGGAIANFAAAELRDDGHNVSLYTFGAPRIGNSAISDYITDQGSNFRITHKKDPVPRLPPLTLGFVHISPEYYINAGNNVTVSAGDIKGPLDGSINFSGNTGGITIDTKAHSWYFNEITACHPDDTFELRRRGELVA